MDLDLLLARRTGRRRPHGIEARPHGGRVPASFAQRRLWFLDQHQAAGSAYTIPAVFRLDGELDVPALDRAVAAVVARHEALRTTFTEQAGELVQVVHPEVAVPLDVVDLTRLPADDREDRFAVLTAAHHQPPFDLREGPLLRASLFRFGAREHRLFLYLHHIVVDGWSLGLVVGEIAAAHRAFAAGEVWAPPRPPVQYADVTRWQHERVADGRLDGQLRYWLERLADAPALDLPSDRPRPDLPGWGGARTVFSLPDGVPAAVRAVGAAAGASPFMVHLATYALVLHRHTGRTDLVVGTPVANRTSVAAEGVVGLLVNTLPIRVDLSGDPTFGELLARVRDAVLTALSNQDVPFDLLVARLRPDRDTGRHPVFQVAMGARDTPPSVAPGGPVTWTAVEMVGDYAKFDQTLTMTDDHTAELEYRTDLFDDTTAARFTGHYRTALAAVVADPGLRVSRTPLLTAAERHWLVRTCNDTEASIDEEPVVRLVERRVAATPDVPAVVDAAGTVSYRELDERANHLAHRLRDAGAGPDVPVVVVLPRSADLVVAALAVAKSGAVYVPLDPADPAHRVDAVVAAVRPCAVLRAVDRDARAETGPAVRVEPGHLAYVIHTSGSTGAPKGVAVEQRGLSNMVAWVVSRFALATGRGTPLAASPGFDASVFEMWPALAAGATLHVPPDEVRVHPARLVRWLADTAVPTAYLPTPAAEAVLTERWPARTALRLLGTAGDALTRAPAAGLPFELLNMYGPTEVTVLATAGVVEPGGCPTIGTPIRNARVHVLDQALTPVPVGVVGELYVGGPGVARGYLGDPRRTAERFVPDPFGPPGARLYRTGDRVRRRADGTLDFVGRVDAQVQLRGHRVEPGEVEHALRQDPRVSAAVVVVRGATPDQVLAALVVVDPDDPPSADDLRRTARRRLPAHMVPTVFERIDEVVLTRNGKVDRKHLAGVTGTALPRAVRPVTSATQRHVAAAWQEALGVDRIGLDDNFFELGGHSFAALRVRDHLGRSLGRPVAVVDLFQFPTLGALAEHLDGGRETAAGVADGQDRARLRRDARGRRGSRRG